MKARAATSSNSCLEVGTACAPIPPLPLPVTHQVPVLSGPKCLPTPASSAYVPPFLFSLSQTHCSRVCCPISLKHIIQTCYAHTQTRHTGAPLSGHAA